LNLLDDDEIVDVLNDPIVHSEAVLGSLNVIVLISISETLGLAGDVSD
jgi:hypothetical protein